MPRAFLLKFVCDRRRYLSWVFEAKKRFGLSVLNYTVTSNHIHLLVKDTGRDVIAQSMQLIAASTAQEYNQRKGRQGAFWEDRYHATAIETNEHLHRCLIDIDLNMVRAGVVNHTIKWLHSGYHEIQEPPERYGLSINEGYLRYMALRSWGIFNKPSVNGLRKRLSGSWRCEAIAGRKQSQLAAQLSSRRSEASLASGPCIGKSIRQAGRTHCVNKVKLTGANLPAKMAR